MRKTWRQSFPKIKKNEILDLLTNANQLFYIDDFEEIEYKLHEACKNGDIELIKIYLSPYIQNETKDMRFKIDKTSKTASLLEVDDSIRQLVIPQSVQYESTEYLITSVIGTNRSIKTVNFAKDSAVKTICYGAFQYSKIEEIYIPSSLKELKGGW